MSEYNIPDDCRYSDKDEWVRMEGDTAVVGISDYAQHQLGDIVFVELPEVGSQVESGESFGVIESVKAVSELYAPLSGTVTAINDGLEENPEVVNEDCYGEGWLISIEPSDESELSELLDHLQIRVRLGDHLVHDLFDTPVHGHELTVDGEAPVVEQCAIVWNVFRGPAELLRIEDVGVSFILGVALFVVGPSLSQ